jgi:nucleotide-binding universal stress UspA family protein
MQGIVVGVDGSPASDAALRWALDEARLRKMPVHAVHAFEVSLPPIGAVPVGAPATALAGLASEQKERQRNMAGDAARAVVQSALEREQAAASGVDVRVTAVEGEPGRVLVELTKQADLLVLGSHGHGAVHDFLLGSVSHACSRHASCPVVVMPATRPEQ